MPHCVVSGWPPRFQVSHVGRTPQEKMLLLLASSLSWRGDRFREACGRLPVVVSRSRPVSVRCETSPWRGQSHHAGECGEALGGRGARARVVLSGEAARGGLLGGQPAPLPGKRVSWNPRVSPGTWELPKVIHSTLSHMVLLAQSSIFL